MKCISGFQFNFDTELNISMKEDCWTKVELSNKFDVKFKMMRREESSPNHEMNKMLSSFSVGAATVHDLETSDKDINISESNTPGLFDPDFGVLNSDLNDTEVVLINTDEFMDGYDKADENFRCNVCGFLTDSVLSVCCHLKEQHSNWQSLLGEKKRKLGNANDYPNWKEELKDKFDELIISKCSQPARDAWENQKVIENKEEYVQVRTEILQRTRSHIVDIYGTVSTPSLKVMEYVVDILSRGYPFMFSIQEGSSTSKSLGVGYGCGGAFGNKYLAKNMRDRISQKQSALRSEELKSLGHCNDEITPVPKKGNRAQKYGKLIEYPFKCVKKLLARS